MKHDKIVSAADQSSLRLNNRQAISLSMQRAISSSQEANEELNRDGLNPTETFVDENGVQYTVFSENAFDGSVSPSKAYHMSAQYQNKHQGKSFASMAISDQQRRSKLSRKYTNQQ